MTIRAFIVDSHELFRAGVYSALDEGEDFQVVGQAATFEEAVQDLAALKGDFDIVLAEFKVGYQLGTQSVERDTPLEGDEEFRKRCVLICDDTSGKSIAEAFKKGIGGFVARDAGMNELLRVIELVTAGGTAFGHSPAARFNAHLAVDANWDRRLSFPELTERQLEILDLLALGHDNQRIARKLALSEKTVRNHVSNLFTRIQVTTRAEAVAWARDAGLGSR